MPWVRRWLPFFLALLGLNMVLSFVTGGPVERTEVPYQPFFLEQLRAGNVEAIASRGDSIARSPPAPSRTSRT